jgi:hypothetical protein
VPSQVKSVFDVVDLDGSGTIDIKEFEMVMHMLQSKAGAVPSLIGRPGRPPQGGRGGGGAGQQRLPLP